MIQFMNRAFSPLQIKSVSETAGRRGFVGTATTISTDEVGDVVVPQGAIYKLPMPLLWAHDSKQPIGWVTRATVMGTGIEVACEVATISEPGTLKDRLDEIWLTIKNRLAQGLSIGFNPIESSRIDGTSGRRYSKWAWRELSVCVLPANSDCSITAIKAAVLASQRALSSTALNQKQGGPMSEFALLSINSRFELCLSPSAGGSSVKTVLTRIQAQRLADELQSFAMNAKSVEGQRSLAFPVALAVPDDAPGKPVYLNGRETKSTLRLDGGKRPGVLYLDKPGGKRSGVLYLDQPKRKTTVVRLK